MHAHICTHTRTHIHVKAHSIKHRTGIPTKLCEILHAEVSSYLEISSTSRLNPNWLLKCWYIDTLLIIIFMMYVQQWWLTLPIPALPCSKLCQQHRSYVLPEWLPEVILSFCNSLKRLGKTPLWLLHYFYPLSFLCHLKLIYCLANIFDEFDFCFFLHNSHVYQVSSFLGAERYLIVELSAFNFIIHCGSSDENIVFCILNLM